MKTIIIGASVEDSDWLKYLADGEYKKQDLQASEDAAKLHAKSNLTKVTKQLRKKRNKPSG